MKTTFLFLVVSLLLTSQTKAQVSNKIETVAIIEILNDNFTSVNQDTIPLSSIHKKVSQLLDEYDLSGNIFPSVTLIANASVSENSIENIKYQIRSTSVQLINLQRKIITNYDGNEVDQNVLDQYNSLITYWNSLDQNERYYREEDLKFVESVALNMSLDQRIRNEKLPGYLPFVKQETKKPYLSMLERDSDLNYTFVLKKDTLDENQISSYKEYPYRLKRRIVNEENVVIIELIDN